MFCNNCGASLPEGSKFCGSCGAAQNVVNTQMPSMRPVNTAQPVQPMYQQSQYQQPVQPQYQPVQSVVSAPVTKAPKKKGSFFKKLLLVVALAVVGEVIYSILTSEPEPPYDPSVTVHTSGVTSQGNQSTGHSTGTSQGQQSTGSSTGTQTGQPGTSVGTVDPGTYTDPGTSTGNYSQGLSQGFAAFFGRNPDGEDWFAKEGLSLSPAGLNFFLAKCYSNGQDMGDVPIDISVELGEELTGENRKTVTAVFYVNYPDAPGDSNPSLWISAFDRYTGTSFECPGVIDMDISCSFDWGERVNKTQAVTVTVTCPLNYDGTIFQFSYNDQRLREENSKVDLNSRLFKINELPYYHNNGCDSLYFAVSDR